MTITRADGVVVVSNQVIPDETDGTPFPLLRLGDAINGFAGGYTIADIDPTVSGIQGLKRGDKIAITYRVQVGTGAGALSALAANGFAVTNEANMTGNGLNTPIKEVTNQTLISVNGTDDGEVFFKNSTYSAVVSTFTAGDTIGLEVQDNDGNRSTAAIDTLTKQGD
jgi:hypothetical protein